MSANAHGSGLLPASREIGVVAQGLVGGAALGAAFRWPALAPLAWVALVPFGFLSRVAASSVAVFGGVFFGAVLSHSLAMDSLRTASCGRCSRTAWHRTWCSPCGSRGG